MILQTHRDLFAHSLDRCVAEPHFITVFYERFFTHSPEARELFHGVDMDVQERSILRALELAVPALEGEPRAVAMLEERAERHSRRNLNIRPTLYEPWLDAMLETAAVFDREWTPEIGEAWEDVLTRLIEFMTDRY